MKQWLKVGIALGLSLSMQQLQAHSRWVAPSHTSVSGEKTTYISVDTSISNDIFHPDKAYGGEVANDDDGFHKNTKLISIAPDGKTTPHSLTSFHRKSVASLPLEQSGTYRLKIESPDLLFTMYKNEKGERRRFWGDKATAQKELPDTVTGLKTMRVNSNVETYVTRNNVSTRALAQHGKGLEVLWKTHPTDLFVDEPVELAVFLNGKPAAGIEFKLVRGNTRYRNDRAEKVVISDENGNLSLSFGEAGLFLLEANKREPSKVDGIDLDVSIFSATLEINPE